MKNRTLDLVVLLLFICAAPVLAETNGDKNLVSAIIPQPRHLELTGKDFLITPKTVIVRSRQAETIEGFAIAQFNRFLKQAHNTILRVTTVHPHKTPANIIVVGNASRDRFLRVILKSKELKIDPKIGEQGYQLWVLEDQIILHANTPAGLFYGLQTLRQLVYKLGKGPVVKGVTITDYPRYELRGFQFDAARCPHSIPLMKRIIRICSAFKLNFVLFREGDDELNAVKYKTNKLGSLNPRAISIKQMTELIEYAGEYHVMVVPEIESLGHSGAKGFLYPELVHEGGRREEYPGIGIHLRKRRLVLENPGSYELLGSIYSEWVPIINSPYVHLGCDEAGGGSGEHLAKLTGILNELGKKHVKKIRPIVWADAAETPEALKGQVIRCLWAYGETGGRVIDANNPFLRGRNQIKDILQPGCKEEVIMAGGSDSYHTPLAKCKYENALANIYSWCQFGKDRANFIGIFAVQWSGNQQDMWLADDLTVAEYGWTPDRPAYDYQSAMARIKAALSKLKDYSNPSRREIDRPCWDGIWLDDANNWSEDIMGRAIPISEE